MRPTTQEGLPALATELASDEEIAALKAAWSPNSQLGRVIARLEAAERQLHDYQARVIPAETRVVELEHRLLELEAKSHDD